MIKRHITYFYDCKQTSTVLNQHIHKMEKHTRVDRFLILGPIKFCMSAGIPHLKRSKLCSSTLILDENCESEPKNHFSSDQEYEIDPP